MTGASKTDITKMINERRKLMQDIASGQKTLKGYSRTRAQMEEKELRKLRNGWVKTDAYNQAKRVRSIGVTTKKGLSYEKSYHRWNQQEKQVMQQNLSLKPEKLRGVMESHFNRAYTYKSISNMRSRMKKRS